MVTERTSGSASKAGSALTGIVRAMPLTVPSRWFKRAPRRCILPSCCERGTCLYCTITCTVSVAFAPWFARAAIGARSSANLPCCLPPVKFWANPVSVSTRSKSTLKRFPQAALWRSPRPRFLGFSVCDIVLTLLKTNYECEGNCASGLSFARGAPNRTDVSYLDSVG